MKTMLKRVRGIVGLGLIWSAAWTVVGFVYNAFTGIVMWQFIPQLTLAKIAGLVVLSACLFAVYGFMTGVLFGTVLAIAERRRTIDSLKIWRVAVWGAIAGVLISVANIFAIRLLAAVTASNISVATISATAVITALSAGAAAASLKLARSGVPPDRKQLQTVDEIDAVAAQGSL